MNSIFIDYREIVINGLRYRASSTTPVEFCKDGVWRELKLKPRSIGWNTEFIDSFRALILDNYQG